MQEVVVDYMNREDLFLLSKKHLDNILVHRETMPRHKILAEVRDLRDLIDRYV